MAEGVGAEGRSGARATIAPALLAEMERRYALRLEVRRRLVGGDASVVWLVASERGRVVVRVSPPSRAAEAIAWTHALARFCAAQVPEVVPPLPAADGTTVFCHRGCWVALFPFVPGRAVDRGDAAEGLAAAHLLARLHSRLQEWSSTGVAQGPHPTEWGPVRGEPVVLDDRGLDAWYTERLVGAGLRRGPIHGDYYRRNLRWHRGRIAGVIDWDDAHVDFVMQEIAWAAWEFAKASDGDDLDFERAGAFLQTYRQAGGPCAPGEYGEVIPFIRRRLRAEIRANLAAARRGEPWDPTYVAAELRAFTRLRGASLA